MRSLLHLFLTLVVVASLAACSTRRADDVSPSGFMDSSLYSKMTTNSEDDRALKVYRSAQFKDASYMQRFTKVMINPIVVYLPDSQLKGDGRKNAKVIADQLHDRLVQSLSKDYTVVNTMGPDVLVVSVAITDLEAANVTMNAISSVVPLAIVTSTAYSYATDEPSYEGQIAMEVKLMDGGTGEILAAGLDRRLGGKGVSTSLDSWHDVESTLIFWSQAMRRALCEARGGTNCVAPATK